MARFNKIPQNNHEGKIVYGDGIVDGIVKLAVSELENVELYEGKKTTKNIKVVFDKNNVTVDVIVKINYTQSVSDIAFKIQEAIRHNVESMTEYHVQNVNVHVFGVTFDEKIQTQHVITEENADKKGNL